MNNVIRVLVVDDETLVRDGLKIALDFESDIVVVAVAQDGVEAIAKAQEFQPDVILMDIQLPIINGLEAIKRIREQDTKVIIFILSAFNEDEYVIIGLANGANGYLLKSAHHEPLIQSIRDSMNGQYFLPVEVAARLVHHLQNR